MEGIGRGRGRGRDVVSTQTPGVDVAPKVDLYERLVLTRVLLEKIDTLYRQGRIHGPVHLGLGQEAIAVGVGSVLRPDDTSIGTYRGHAHVLARGASPEDILRELLGKRGGLCAGKGGSMHLTSVEHGYYGSYAIVGAHLPIANGLAWAAKMRGDDSVTVCFFGDGAVNIGAFHEAVNLAAVWKLPVVFVCENNQYMEYTHISRVIPTERPLVHKASAYGLDEILVDGNDLHAVREVVGRAVDLARQGAGPALIEADTYRLKGHSGADGAAYRPPDEVAAWAEREPLLHYRASLLDAGVATEAELDSVVAQARTRMNAVAQAVLEEDPPDPTTAWTDMWSDGSSQWRN